MTLPPDRSHVGTERRHPASGAFDALATEEQVRMMIEDHEAVTRAAAGQAGAIAGFIDALLPRVEAGGRLVYAGAGTSGRLGVLDASECPPTFQSDPGQVIGLIAGGDAALRRSSERREDEFDGLRPELEAIDFGPRDALLGIAAGGTTPYVLGGLREARRRGGLTAFLTCAPGAAQVECDHLIELDTGPEILTGSTRLKAGGATKLVLNAVTTVLFTRLGKVYGNLMVDLAASNDKLVDRALRTLREIDPALGREEAFALLDAAGGSVKLAIVMRALDVGRGEAEALLLAARGRVRDVLERAKKNGSV